MSSRFAFVLWSGKLGGAETFTAALASALRRKGDEATVVFVGDADRLGERLDGLNVPHVSLGAPRGSGVLTRPRRFARLVGEAGPDGALLVSAGYLGSTLRVAGYRARMVAVEHGALLQWPNLSPGRRLIRRVDRALGTWAHSVEVAPCDFMLDEVRRHPHARQTTRIHYGIDLRRYKPPGARPRAGDDLFVVGYAGRLIEGKGVGDLVRAFAVIARERPSLLRIAGDGPHRPALERVAAELGVSDAVEFVGWTHDLPEFWHGCDVAVAPSTTWTEALPLAILEALGCGMPVIAYDGGGVPESIDDGRTGRLIPRGDLTALAAALQEYGRDAQLIADHSRAARERAEAMFDIDRCADAYLEVMRPPVDAD